MNLEDIARLAGVSRSTVSRVVNDDPRVSEAVRARVKAVIAEYNYHPNAAARSLASRRTRVVGLLIPGMASQVFSDPWFPVMIQGCMDGCQEQDLSLMLLMEPETDPDADKASRRFRSIAARSKSASADANWAAACFSSASRAAICALSPLSLAV